MRIEILVIAASLLASPVCVAEWARIGKVGEMAYSVDFSTLKIDGGTRRVWVRFDFDKPEKEPQYLQYNGWIKSSIDLMDFDCDNRKSRALQSTQYRVIGDDEKAETHGKAEWTYAIPQTVGSLLLNAVCTYEEY